MPKTLTRAKARDLALTVLRLKLENHPELAKIKSTETVRAVALGLKTAFGSRGITVDEECAEGIAEAMQEIIPAARDDAPSVKSGLWTPSQRRPRLWKPS